LGTDVPLAADLAMDLKLPIDIIDELSDDEVHSQGELDLASGEIRNVRYKDYDVGARGNPAEREDYEFSVGVLRNGAREVEFRVEVDALGGRYFVTPSELLELKGRAAKLFSQAPPKLH
jgi:hypothetical protein